jgi:hypothetical protein
VTAEEGAAETLQGRPRSRPRSSGEARSRYRLGRLHRLESRWLRRGMGSARRWTLRPYDCTSAGHGRHDDEGVGVRSCNDVRYGVCSRVVTPAECRCVLAVLLWIKRSHESACEPVKATNDARRVRFGIAALRDGIGRASVARTPAVADERGPHTRPGDLAPLRAGTGTQVSNLETFTPYPQLLPVTRLFLAPASATSIAA